MTTLRLEEVVDHRSFGLACYLRTVAYVLEQGCPPCEEFDELDNTAQHYLGWAGDMPVTTCRTYLAHGNEAKIGRIVTAKDHRGKGYASAMLRTVIEILRQNPDICCIRMSAQEQAIGLYEKLGFTAYGEMYSEASIPHRMMKLDVREAA